MAISVNWVTRVITVPKADMTLVSNDPFDVYQLDVDVFRLSLKDLEDDEAALPWPDTHRHNTEVVLGNITLARVVEIINGYTVTFENGNYAVDLVGANNNITDVVNLNSVMVRSYNSAGLQKVETGVSGLTAGESADLSEVKFGVAHLQEHEHNKLVTSKSEGKQILYESDKVTPMEEFYIYEDEEETEPYRGRGAEVRDPVDP